MKIKWFIRGLGVGIIITALILCITYRNDSKSNNIIQQAKELGMEFPKKPAEDQPAEASEPPSAPPSVPPSAAPTQTVTGAAVQGTDDGQTKEGVKEQSEADQKAKDKLDKSAEDISSASQYKGGKKSFVVRSGLLSSSVAREMEQAGIIEDADAFDEFIEKNGYGKLVRSGKYDIPTGADFETIAKIITRQQ